MRKLIVTMWQSLDGFIAGPNGEMDWITDNFDAQMGEYEGRVLVNVDGLVFGRVTYDSFAGAWPSVPDNLDVSEEERAYARLLNDMKKVVFSRTLERAEWNNSTLVREDIGGAVTALKAQPGENLLIYGSASIVRQLTDLRLVDEYQLLIYPLVLGSGKSLFAGLEKRAEFRLVKSHIHDSGVAELTYTLK